MHAGDWIDIPKYEIGRTMEAFITVKLCIGFLYTPAKYLTMDLRPELIPRGYY